MINFIDHCWIWLDYALNILCPLKKRNILTRSSETGTNVKRIEFSNLERESKGQKVDDRGFP